MSNQSNTRKHESWSSRAAFLLAIIGASIGLGNLWRFPYIAGENGGGAFVLVYVFFVFVISVPLVMTELAMGRRGHHSPVNTLRILCQQENKHRFWHTIGWISIFAPLIALSFYSVIAGWSLDYIVKAASGVFSGISNTQAGSTFEQLLASPGRLMIWHSLFLGATIVIVGLGIRRGIEWATRYMMPALFFMLVLLVIYAHIAGDPLQAWRFMFNPDFSSLSAAGVLMALGQALFSVSVGTGALLTYGAYLPRNVAIPGSTWIIALTDTGAALLAGLAIFPIVFASGLDPAEGPGLMFVSLPVALGQMPGGYVFSIVFFMLVFCAGFTSAIAMLEPFVSWLVEHKGYRRFPVTICSGVCIWLLGLTAVLSFNIMKDFTPLDMIPLYEGRTMFSILDFTVSNIVLPINAFLIALFAGWIISRQKLMDEIGLLRIRDRQIWSVFVRYLAPLGVGAVVVYSFLA